MKLGNLLFAQSDERGALPTLAAATRDLPGGSYLGPDGFQEMRGYPTLVGAPPAAGDPELARRLWEASARLTGVDFPARAGLIRRNSVPIAFTLDRRMEVISSCH